jgi:hypothetical protein
LMGDIFAALRGEKLQIKVRGTDQIVRLELIRNNAIIYTAPAPNKKNVDLEYVDMAPVQGTNWYYVRVTQIDKNLAWSSPVWITYK